MQLLLEYLVTDFLEIIIQKGLTNRTHMFVCLVFFKRSVVFQISRRSTRNALLLREVKVN